MNDAIALTISAVTGIFLAAFFFGGLWWTVKKTVTSKNPMLWFFGSLALRTCVVLGGFYAVSLWRFERLAACLAGFFAAHIAFKILLFPAGPKSN